MDGGRPRLLLVEDYRPNLIALEAVLKGLGAPLVGTQSGREAIACARLHRFEAMILDLQLPDMGGVEVCKAIRSQRMNENTPVFFLTSEDLAAQDLALARSQSPLDILRKPIDASSLKERVACLLAERVCPDWRTAGFGWTLPKRHDRTI